MKSIPLFLHQLLSARLTFSLLACILSLGLIQPGLANPIAADEVSVAPLLNGETIPDIQLTDSKGQSVSLKALSAEKPTVFFFYRGGWCPFCNNQMGQLKEIEPRLIELGYQLVGISPDSPEKLAAAAGERKLEYLLLSDANMEAAKAFGLAFFTSEKTTQTYLSRMKLENPLFKTPEGDERLVLPVPAVYITDTQGLIHFQYVNPNFRVRPAPRLILTAAELARQQG
ncbi:peroxiredoxin-like family protein [Shewanella litorisediminis]|uniref:thioredoxin-dependent peroxiredoxin n=1 Tax=Shewanella litorisediminis TaxID=1173586 RepID=A0ABX7G5L0_9GAMM|nr:peroxiredoxin-like family protein [Shewanella litorisediminis]MCL2917424.1 AhpC/TSA family protein [Shewanella litorisediminis]QRH02557.1 AhpC/TSA family protein [Shewanella litorisediminis]